MPTAPKPQNGSICRIDSRLNQDYLLTGDCAAGLIISARSKIQVDADVICHDADAVPDATITAECLCCINHSPSYIVCYQQ